MIISPLYSMAILAVEGGGEHSITQILSERDPNFHYKCDGNLDCAIGKCAIPAGYQYVFVDRDSTGRLMSYFHSLDKYQKTFYSGFEQYMNFIVDNKSLSFLDEGVFARIINPCAKLYRGDYTIRCFPRSKSYFLSDLPTPDITINYNTFDADVRSTFNLLPSDNVPPVDDGSWTEQDYTFNGMQSLILQYEN